MGHRSEVHTGLHKALAKCAYRHGDGSEPLPSRDGRSDNSVGGRLRHLDWCWRGWHGCLGHCPIRRTADGVASGLLTLDCERSHRPQVRSQLVAVEM